MKRPREKQKRDGTVGWQAGQAGGGCELVEAPSRPVVLSCPVPSHPVTLAAQGLAGTTTTTTDGVGSLRCAASRRSVTIHGTAPARHGARAPARQRHEPPMLVPLFLVWHAAPDARLCLARSATQSASLGDPHSSNQPRRDAWRRPSNHSLPCPGQPRTT